MVKRPVEDFWNAAHDTQPEPSQEAKDPRTIRDKDNTAHAIRPPLWGIAGTARQPPLGVMGYREPLEGKPMAKPEIDITKGDPEKDLWVHGRITSMEGYTFAMKNYELPSDFGMNGGTISKLEIRENGNQVAVYDRGWDMKPDTPQAREAVEKIIQQFDPPDKEFKPIAPPDQDKDHGRER